MTEEEIKEAIEHRDVLVAVKEILTTSSGKCFFKYLFKHLGVGELPELGLTGEILMDKMGFLRAGNSIFKLVAEANAEAAGLILAENERWKNAQIYADEREG